MRVNLEVVRIIGKKGVSATGGGIGMTETETQKKKGDVFLYYNECGSGADIGRGGR